MIELEIFEFRNRKASIFTISSLQINQPLTTKFPFKSKLTPKYTKHSSLDSYEGQKNLLKSKGQIQKPQLMQSHTH